MAKIYAYARCSLGEEYGQDLRRQMRELETAGAEEIITEREHTLVVGMTATPDNISQLNCWINLMPIDAAALRQYENKNVYCYASLPDLLWYLPKGKRGALYVTQVEKMQEHEQTAIAAGFTPICVWSPNAEHKMTSEQEAARRYILEHEEVPPQYDLLIFNDSLATSINLYGELDFIIIHTANETTITQARGRYRNDLENLYLHSVDECGGCRATAISQPSLVQAGL